jgi:RsiW-degrading membrane proteinase PrsW (M82 family)
VLERRSTVRKKDFMACRFAVNAPSTYGEERMTQEQFTQTVRKQPLRMNLWWRVLFTGLVTYLLGIVILVLTGNPVLFPTVVMIGNFVVPVAYVVFFSERAYLSRLTLKTIFMSFFYGGVLGVFASGLLEPIFIRQLNFSNVFLVGLIEEFGKIFGVIVIARRLRHDSELDGIVLGAAAGMGFASLESNGYAFVAFLGSGGSLSVTVGVTLLRGLLSPVGHGTWTAILASVLFRESEAGHFHINHKVVGVYLIVVILHGLWDGLPAAIAVLLSPGFDVFIGQASVGGMGLFILWRRWREAKRLQVGAC